MSLCDDIRVLDFADLHRADHVHIDGLYNFSSYDRQNHEVSNQYCFFIPLIFAYRKVQTLPGLIGVIILENLVIRFAYNMILRTIN